MYKKTLVIGASENPERYSNIAINRLLQSGHPVVALGHKKGNVQGVEISNSPQPFTDIDTVTLYLNPTNQNQYYDYILQLQPKRIIFNPGTENLELAKLAQSKGILTEDACTLVLLSLKEY